MIQTILVPLDGSKEAEHGLAPACRIAGETGATLRLIRAVEFHAFEEAERVKESHDLREARAYLHGVQHRLRKQGFSVEAEILPGDPVKVILFAAQAHEVDVMSIASYEHSGLQHALLGSVAETVLSRSTTPILLTRASAQPTFSAFQPLRTILVPLDGTPFAERALTYLVDQQLGRAASVILLRTVAPATLPVMPSMMGEAVMREFEHAEQETAAHRMEAEAYLRHTGTAFLKDTPWRAQTALATAADGIVEVARSEDAELIVMATHGRHGWDRLLHGSVTGHLLHHSPVPLLILSGSMGHTAAAPVDHAATSSEADGEPIARGQRGQAIRAV